MSQIRDAYDKASGPKTPWNPSKRAIAKVLNPLPAPKTCRYCKSEVEIVQNMLIYGKNYGDWPWAYRCTGCSAYVGMHPYTNIPLGTLADEELRNWRKWAKNEFIKLSKRREWNRNKAYAWLANELKWPVEQVHFGWFEVQDCEFVYNLCLENNK